MYVYSIRKPLTETEKFDFNCVKRLCEIIKCIDTPVTSPLIAANCLEIPHENSVIYRSRCNPLNFNMHLSVINEILLFDWRSYFYTFINQSAYILPLRSFISPPTSRRRGQQAAKNHRGVLFVFTIAILAFAETVLASTLFTLTSSRDFTYDNC